MRNERSCLGSPWRRTEDHEKKKNRDTDNQPQSGSDYSPPSPLLDWTNSRVNSSSAAAISSVFIFAISPLELRKRGRPKCHRALWHLPRTLGSLYSIASAIGF